MSARARECMYRVEFLLTEFEKMINNDGGMAKAHSSQPEEILSLQTKAEKTLTK